MHKLLSTIVLLTLLSPDVFAGTQSSKVVLAKDIEWGYLNPLRGNLSPGAANLWGDRTQNTGTGMLVRFNKGFQSPPHIHNITYRGIVIDGRLHNDDPLAERMWMPVSSYWTQPAGENHITAADGESNLIYLEIDSGPYLVKPSKDAFDNQERPVNVHSTNIVWLDSKHLEDISAEGVSQTYTWGDTSAVNGSMLKIDKNADIKVLTNSSEFRMVLIAGKLSHRSNDSNAQVLLPGSYVESTGRHIHHLVSTGETETVVYIRTLGSYKVD
jgi:hypothetical protein